MSFSPRIFIVLHIKLNTITNLSKIFRRICFRSKICVLYILILLSFDLCAQDCIEIEKMMTPQYEELKQMIAVENANKAYVFSDSLLQLLKSKKRENCPISFWIAYYQAESLELLMDFESALKIYYMIIKNAEQQNEWEIVAHSYISVARCHESLGRDKDCLRYLHIASELIKKYKLEKVEPTFAFRYSSYHRIFGSLDTALVYAYKAVDLGRKLDILRAQTDGYLLLGVLHKDLESSTKYFREAARLFKGNKNYLGAASMYYNIAKRYWSANLSSETMDVVDTIQMFSTIIVDKNKAYYRLLGQIAEIKKNYFEQKRNIDSAYFYLNLTRGYEKESQWMVNQEKIVSDAIGFAIEKEKEKVIYAEKITFISRIGLAVMGLLMFVLSILVVNNYKKRKQITLQNSTISANNEALKQSIQKQSILLSEIHHRVKNNLQLVISLLTLHGHNTNNPSVKNYLDDLSRKVFSIALIHEQLYRSGDFEKIDTKEYLKELVTNFQILQENKTHIEIQTDADHIMLNLETVLPLGIICSELISNSLKYAKTENEAIKIYISLKAFGNKYLLKYSDNGPGINPEIPKKAKQGMGLTLINNMVRQLQGESSRYNEGGAIFTLLFEEKMVSTV